MTSEGFGRAYELLLIILCFLGEPIDQLRQRCSELDEHSDDEVMMMKTRVVSHFALLNPSRVRANIKDYDFGHRLEGHFAAAVELARRTSLLENDSSYSIAFVCGCDILTVDFAKVIRGEIAEMLTKI